MPHRTFAEARRIISRNDDRDDLIQEYDRKVKEAQDRMKQLNAPQRIALNRDLDNLTKAAVTNADRMEQLKRDLEAKRLPQDEFQSHVRALSNDMKVIERKAARTKDRLLILDDREQNAPEALDRIAQTTGMGKMVFNF